jgi:transposase InsO family protein
MDITHFNSKPFLTIVDCSSRYAIWKQLPSETSHSIVEALREVFATFGPPEKMLSDNGLNLTGQHMAVLLSDWQVVHDTSCAYRPQGNGICERNHRTIKRMATRSGRYILEMLLWYNATTHDTTGKAPYEVVFSPRGRLPFVRDFREELRALFIYLCSNSGKSVWPDIWIDQDTLGNNPMF